MSTQNISSAPGTTQDIATGDIVQLVESMGKRAKAAARKLAAAAPAAKIDALIRLAGLLESREADILAANAKDLAAAEAAGMDAPRMDRLRLTPRIMAEMAAACRHRWVRWKPRGSGPTACWWGACASPTASSPSSTNRAPT